MTTRPSVRPAAGSRASTPRPTRAPGAQLALLIGALLSLVGGVVVLIDQLGADTIWRHLQQAYPAGYSAAELVDDKSALVTILYSLTGLAILGWLTALALVRRRSRWAKPVTLGLFVVGGLTTTAGLWVTDEGYGKPLPTWLALIFAAPAVAGLVATVALLRSPRSAAAH